MIDLIAFRRDLHRHPECGFELTRTPRLIAQVLRDAGLDVSEGIGRVGLVATLPGCAGAGAIGLRADMDALPINEVNEFEYRSQAPGKFHGCGHDGHATMLLAAAIELAQGMPPEQTIHFIFQPDEENGNGAKAMISDGLFQRFPMQAIYGMHNLPGMPVGQFATRSGPFCAFEDNFEICLSGKGGHASMPEVGIDPIVLGASIVMQLQTIVSRGIAPADHAVVSVTGFETDGARNILASNVLIGGDCRGFSKDVSKKIKTRMQDIVTGLTTAHRAKANINYTTSFRPLVNSPTQTDIALAAAASVGQVDTGFGRVGFSEDFAEYLRHCPGSFILMGNGTEGAGAMPLHNPSYDFNDAAIPFGRDYWCALARQAANVTTSPDNRCP